MCIDQILATEKILASLNKQAASLKLRCTHKRELNLNKVNKVRDVDFNLCSLIYKLENYKQGAIPTSCYNDSDTSFRPQQRRKSITCQQITSNSNTPEGEIL